MYSPPFHRRILPWVFASLFLASAPVLVFYTAGYRWNPKKDKVERNGTLIVDTKPTGAFVFLNENNTNEQSPITIQNIRPGEYIIQLKKSGYHSWQKKLDLKASIVTFASNIHLWKETNPTLLNTSTSSFPLSANDTLTISPKTFHIRESNETGDPILFDERTPDRGYVLPSGTWSIVTQQSNTIILQDGAKWLSVDLQANTPIFQRANGDRLRPFINKNETTNLLINNGEVWLWNPKYPPELLFRQSESIVDAIWYQDGSSILIATQNEISALELDSRNGRIRTTLATFEKITALELQSATSLFISGSYANQDGLWNLQL
ncbi:MAG: PEGA domain-containing protein [bacterium]|nr:PEGA domain-containing protein [bacterium]